MVIQKGRRTQITLIKQPHTHAHTHTNTHCTYKIRAINEHNGAKRQDIQKSQGSHSEGLFQLKLEVYVGVRQVKINSIPREFIVCVKALREKN